MSRSREPNLRSWKAILPIILALILFNASGEAYRRKSQVIEITHDAVRSLQKTKNMSKDLASNVSENATLMENTGETHWQNKEGRDAGDSGRAPPVASADLVPASALPQSPPTLSMPSLEIPAEFQPILGAVATLICALVMPPKNGSQAGALALTAYNTVQNSFKKDSEVAVKLLMGAEDGAPKEVSKPAVTEAGRVITTSFGLARRTLNKTQITAMGKGADLLKAGDALKSRLKGEGSFWKAAADFVTLAALYVANDANMLGEMPVKVLSYANTWKNSGDIVTTVLKAQNATPSDRLALVAGTAETVISRVAWAQDARLGAFADVFFLLMHVVLMQNLVDSTGAEFTVKEYLVTLLSQQGAVAQLMQEQMSAAVAWFNDFVGVLWLFFSLLGQPDA